jgi:hypothetical protein
MTKLPAKCVVDTNVPITANRESESDAPTELLECISKCVSAIEHVVYNKQVKLVLDEGNEIFDEYRRNLSLKGQQPRLGDVFFKWVHDNGWSSERIERVPITKNGDSYDQFPAHEGLKNFDVSDRKFVAVANAHPEKPPILQATDSKWWGWDSALRESGINVYFVCRDYIKKKYKKKISP